MNLKMDIELDALRANVSAFAAMSRTTASQAVRDISVWILQAGYGKSGVPQAKKARRDILRAVRRYRRGVEEIVMGGRPTAPGDRALFLIPRPRNRRPIGKSGGRKFWTFETLEKAKQHQAITFRGVAQAGFWSQLPALGKPVPASFARRGYLADVPGLRESVVQLDSATPEVTVTNKSTAIGFEKSDFWKRSMLSSVNNRIAGYAKTSEKRLAAFRAAGGMVYDEATQGYNTLEDTADELPF